jgi:hypothetical protein
MVKNRASKKLAGGCDMQRLSISHSNQQPMHSIQQPIVHLLRSKANQGTRHAENTYKRPNSSKAAGSFSGCGGLRAPRNRDSGAAQSRAVGATYRSQAGKAGVTA